MATTVTAADLTVTIIETYNLNGVDYGNTMNKTYTANGQVSQRVMSIAAYGTGGTHVWTDILGLTTVDGKGQVVKADYKYFRINNLDDTTGLTLRIFNGVDYLYFEVAAGSSAMFMDAGVDAQTAESHGNAALVDITSISGQAQASATDIDVEFVIVTA
tara:strand:+ start:583 stop:1059 length:477 start_codon:yes stop_codon:yes gene_type:complete